jgi:hypothetical protein
VSIVLFRKKEERSSFLKKRSKKLLRSGGGLAHVAELHHGDGEKQYDHRE